MLRRPRRVVAEAAWRCATRHLSERPSAHLGVLHVYRLEPCDPPRGAKLRLVFPSEGTAQLAQAAERGEAILVPESALTGLLGGTQPKLGPGSNGSSEAPQMLLGAGADGGNDNALMAGASDDALALAEHAMPLADALASGGVEDPDWRSTAELVNPSATTATPTAAQQAVLTASAEGDEVALSVALAACSTEELGLAQLPPSLASPLHLAATSGAVGAVRLLLDAGLSVEAVAANGSTPLHWAAGGGHNDVVRVLLEAGAGTRGRSSTWRSTVRGNDSGQTPAHWAAASGHEETLEVKASRMHSHTKHGDIAT